MHLEGHGNMETKLIIKLSYYSALMYILYEICLRIHVMCNFSTYGCY